MKVLPALFPKQPPVDIPLDQINFVVLDTETTGLNPDQDRILSIGAIKLRDGRIKPKEALELYIHQQYFDASVVPIHGLLKNATGIQISEKEGLEILMAHLKDTIIVGHHIRFDIEILNRALLRHGFPPLDNPFIDTALLYSKTLLKSPLLKKKSHYSLDDLAKRFDLDGRDRHTALGDAYLTAMAFVHILGQLNAKYQLNRRKLLNWGIVPF
jgi:DNA polymerase-3 subunit epsilon